MKTNSRNRQWTDVAFFADMNDARKLEFFLRERRFESRVYNDRLLQLFLFLCPPRATFRTQVRLMDHKVVTDLLERDSLGVELIGRAIHCPSCNSLRIQYPQMTRKFFLPTLMLHLGIIFRIIDHEAYCENCHFLWNLPKKSTPEMFEPLPEHPTHS
jgi:hypothetical protein